MHGCPSPRGQQAALPQSHTEHGARGQAIPTPAAAQLGVDLAGGRGRTLKIYELGPNLIWVEDPGQLSWLPQKNGLVLADYRPPAQAEVGPGPCAGPLHPSPEGRPPPQRNHSPEFDLGWEQRALSLVCTSAPN